jgi:hypothetical protein
LEKLAFGENKDKGKIDNEDWMIVLNRPRPFFIFIGCDDLPCKQCFTTRNQAKLLILLKLEVTRLDHALGAVRPPGGLVTYWLLGTPVSPPWEAPASLESAFAKFECQQFVFIGIAGHHVYSSVHPINKLL